MSINLFFIQTSIKLNKKFQIVSTLSSKYKHFRKVLRKSFKQSNIDENNDELTDKIRFEAILPVNSYDVKNIDLYLFFQYGFRVYKY